MGCNRIAGGRQFAAHLAIIKIHRNPPATVNPGLARRVDCGARQGAPPLKVDPRPDAADVSGLGGGDDHQKQQSRDEDGLQSTAQDLFQQRVATAIGAPRRCNAAARRGRTVATPSVRGVVSRGAEVIARGYCRGALWYHEGMGFRYKKRKQLEVATMLDPQIRGPRWC